MRRAATPLHERLRVPAGIAVAALAVTGALRAHGALEGTESYLYDLRVKGVPAAEVSGRIVPIPIDDATTERVGRWPWKRPVAAELARDLSADGARVVLFDVSFKDATEPAEDARFVELMQGATAIVSAYGGDFDVEIAEDVSESQRAALRAFVPNVPVAIAGAEQAFPDAPVVRRIYAPIAPYVAIARGGDAPSIALARISKDHDGKIRHMPLLFRWEPTPKVLAIADPGERRWLPSLVLATVCRWYGVDPATVRAEPGKLVLPRARPPGEEATRDVEIPVDESGAMLVRYARSGLLAARFHSAYRARAAAVPDPRARPQVEDRIAIVYTSFSSSGDKHATPLSREVPGGLINAEAVNTILTEDFVRVAPGWLLPLVLLLEGVLLVAFAARWTSYRLVGAWLGLLFVLFTAGFAVFNAVTLVVELAAPALMALLGGAGVVVYKTWLEDRERVDLLFAMRALQNQAMKERAAAQAAASSSPTQGGVTAGPTSATDAVKRSADYGKFIDSLRDISNLENTYIGKNYRLLNMIDEGGMGIVFRAYDESLERTVAIKVLTRFSAKLLKRFLNEAKAVGRLHHPNVVQVYEMASEGDIPYIVMEYVQGTSLSQRIRDDGPLPVIDAVEVVLQVARGLGAAHARQIIHRDIKTSNILLAPDGTAKIIDFGIAKIFRAGEAGEGVTGEKEIVGTADYMSPEQGQGHPVDARSDIYSLGITLYRVLTGRLPFRAEDTVAVLLKQIKDPLPDIRKHVPDVPAEAIRVLHKMVEKSPADRYQTCGDLCADLEAFLHHARAAQGAASPAMRRAP